MTRQFIKDLTGEALSSRARKDDLFAILKPMMQVATGEVD